MAKGGLSDSEAHRQIEQMISFVRLEAEEKANEILTKAREDAAIELQVRLQKGKARVKGELARVEREREVLRRVSSSKVRSEELRRLLEARAGVMEEARLAARRRLVGGDGAEGFRERDRAGYEALVRAMVVETGVRLCPGDAAAAAAGMAGETELHVDLRVLRDDQPWLESQLPALQDELNRRRNVDAVDRAQKFGLPEALGKVPPVTLHIDDNAQLGPESGGGVVVARRDEAGRPSILADDTLTRRLDIAFERMGHVVRAALFPKTPKTEEEEDLFA